MVPKGLKYVKCECGMGGKNSPGSYVREQDPIQGMLETRTKNPYFKVVLPETGSELQVAIWASSTPEHFLTHVAWAVHDIK